MRLRHRTAARSVPLPQGGTPPRWTWLAAMIALAGLAGLLPTAVQAQQATAPAAGDPAASQALQFVYEAFKVDPSSFANLLNAGGSASILQSISHAVNAGALTVAVAVLVWTSLMAVLGTAHEGKLLGTRMSTMWVPVRSVVSIAALTPILGGYSLIQVIVLVAAYAGWGVADMAWGNVLDHLRDRGPMISRPVYSNAGPELVNSLYKSNLCALKANQAAGEVVVRIPGQFIPVTTYTPGEATPFDDDTGMVTRNFVLSFDGVEGSGYKDGVCGSIAVEQRVSRTELSIASAFQEGMLRVIEKINADLNKLAIDQVNQGLSRDEVAARARAAVLAYEDGMRTNAARAVSSTTGNESQASTAKFFEVAKQTGWLSAGGWYWTLSNIERRQAELLNNPPSITRPDLASFPDGTADDIDLQLQRADMAANMQVIANDLNDVPPGTADSDGFMSHLRSMLNPITRKLSTASHEYFLNKNEGDLLATMSGFGHAMVGIAVTGWFTVNIAEGVADGAKKSILGRAAELTGLTGGLVGAGKAVILPLLILMPTLFFAGFWLAYYLPAIPLFAWLAAVYGWMVMLIESVIVAPIWAAAHASAEGEGFSGQYARQGYMLLISVIARPLFMVAGLIGAFVIMWYSGQILRMLLMPMMQGIYTDTLLGITSLLAMIFILFVSATVIVKRSFELVHELPDRALRWIGGAGEQLGENALAGEQGSFMVAGINVQKGVTGVKDGSRMQAAASGAGGNKKDKKTSTSESDHAQGEQRAHNEQSTR